MRKPIIINKKSAILICILIFSFTIAILNYDLPLKLSIHSNSNRILETKTSFEPSIPPEGTVEEIYHDTIMSLIYPYVADAITDYYGQPFAHDPWSDTILSIERPNGYRTYYFVIELEVIPYYGPHNSVGIDHLTISIKTNEVKVEKFEHIKTYFIPSKPKTP